MGIMKRAGGKRASTVGSSVDTAARTVVPAAMATTAIALEPRFLFDAAGVATAVEVAHADDHAIPAATPDTHAVDQQLLAGLAGQPAATDAAAQPAATSAAPAPTKPAHEVVFVDASVPQYEKLLQGLPPATQVVAIDSNRDGLAQIADALKGQQNVTGIHILSHGSAGEISLGNAEITSATLATHTAELDAIKGALAPGADILIYGCDVAQGEQGVAFVNRLAAATGADVAASVDDTGSVALGGNWVLEEHTGAIETSIAVSAAGQEAYQGLMANILPGSTGWTPLMQGTLFDPNNDTQAKAADTDLVGDASHAVLYGAYDNNGTPDNPNDDFLAFRIRIDNPTSSTEFGGVAVIGIDANQDGRIDLFLAVDGRNNTQAVRILDPGTGLNNSPNTTTTSALPAGWLANNGVYSFTATNYAVAAVSAANDPQWTGNTDLGNDGKTDVFVSFKIPMADIATVMAKPSASDRNGNVGPRGTTGIAGFTKDTTVSYVLMTETQPGPINGDLGGVGANYDKNATFAQLGAITGPMTPSNPVAAGQSVTINHTIGDGNLSASEDGAVLLQGKVGSTTADGSWVKVTVTDGASHSVTGYAQVSGGAWQMTKDLSSLNDGTLSVSAELWTTGTGSGSHVTNSVGDSTTVLHDRTPPVIAVSALATAGQPSISGTSDLPVGSTLTVTVDPNGDGILTDAVVYKTTVKAGNVWSIDTAVAAPFSGAVAAGGFTRYASVAVSGTDDAGNSTSVLAITKPTVNTLTTNSVTPTISGTWGGANGGTDSLSVRVNNVTYTTANGLTISGTGWSVALTANTGANALASGQSYDVVAMVTRTSPGGSTTDASVNELQIISGPAVDIGANGIGTAGTANTNKPTIAGTATPNALVVLVIDLDNNSTTTGDRVTYSAVADGSGAWSVNTASASPLSGTFPASGLSGTVGLTATVTDSNGRTAVDTEALTITVPSITIAGVGGALPVVSGSTSSDGILNGTEDDATVVLISATNVATNQTIAVSVSDGVHSAVTGTASYDAVSGKWKATLNLSGLDDGTGNLTVSASFNAGQATASTTVSHDSHAYATVVSSETGASTPTVAGTADVTSGSLVIRVDRYTKAGSSIAFSNTTYYSVGGGTVGAYSTSSGVTFNTTTGAWSLSVSQSGGTFNNTGEYLLVTVIGSDSSGNAANATGQVTKIANNTTGPTIAINTIAGDDVIDATEDSSVTISGTTSVSGGYVKVKLSDGNTTTTQQVQAGTTLVNGAYVWSLSGQNLHAWKDGTILVDAQLLDASNGTVVRASASATPTHIAAVAPGIAITTPIGDGNLSANEDSSVTVTGTTTNAAGKTVTVTVTDGTTTKTGTATVNSDGTWSTTFTGANALSGLNDATLQVSASVTANGSTATANTSVLHDRTPPVVSITPLLTAGTPVIAGSTDLPAGSVITVTIDPDNVSGTVAAVSYQATVLADHSWSVDLSSATPTSGSLPTGGLTAYAKITATGQDAAGNSTTTTALDKPVVNSLLTNSTTPTVTGTWANIAGQTLYVVINGKAYGATAGQSVTLGGTSYTTVAGLSTNLDSWSVATQTLAAGTYEVAAYAVSGATQTADATVNELVVDLTAPAVAIATITDDTGSSATDWITKDGTLVFTGTAEANANVVVTLTNAAGTMVFSTTVLATGGAWSVDRTGQAALADGAYTLTAVAKDAAGNSATATRSLTVDTSATLAVTTNYKAASTAPVITGSSDLEAGQSLDVTVNGATYRVQAQSGGGWSLDLATAQPTSGTKTALVDGQSYTITATGTDVAGNTATAGKAMLVDVSAPKVAIFSPLDWNGGNSNGVLTLTEDGSVVIKGTTAKGASTTALAGGQIAVTITDGTTTISDTATVQADGSWSLAALNLRGLASGTITVAATYVDQSGVAYTDVATVLHDKSGSVSIDGISSDTGAPGDFVTADQTLVFRGSATAGQPVTVTLTNSGNGTVFSGTVTAAANGTWTYDNQGNTLPSGTYTLTATSNGTTATQAITVDAVAPAGPVTVTSQTTGSVTPTITGTATVGAGETLTVTVNGKTYTAGDGSLTLTGTSWSLTIPAADAMTPASTDNGFNGKYSVTATIRDTAGNTLSDSTSDELTVTDVTKPVIDLDSVASGVNYAATSTDGAAVSLDNDSAAATVVEANKLQNVTVTVGGLQNGSSGKLILGQTTVAADGSSGSKLDILVGNVRVNLNYASGVFTISKYDWSSLTAAEAQAVIRDIQYQNALGTGSTAGQRTFAFRTVDQAGNLSDAATATVTVASGSTPTLTPTQTVVITKAVDDVAPRTGDLASGAVTNDTAPELQGTISAALGAGEVVAVYRGATRLGTATVTGTAWTYADSALSNGATYSYTARVENATNQGTASTAFALTIDTAAPSAPGLALATDSGASGSDRISNVGTVAVSGLETGATWEYTTDGGTNWTAGTGSSFTLAEGSYASGAVKVRQTDSAGNLGTEASLGATVIDTTAPVIASATVSGTSLVLGYTEANRLDAVNRAGTVAFTVKVGGSTVTVSAVSVDAVNKTVTLTLGTAVVAGQSVTVSYADPTVGDDANATQDEAGNDATGFTDRAVANATPATTPTQTVAISKAVDDVAPKVGDLTSGASTNDTAPELRGTISAALGTGEVLAVYRDGVKIGTATVSGTAWTYADGGLSNGSTYSYTARVENLVNQGTASTAFALTIDTTAPAAPGLALATDSGTSASDAITKVGTVTVSGLENGASWEYSLDNGVNWTAGSGSSIALSGDGAKSVLVRQTDAAGNISANSAAFAFTLDTTVAAPGVALATDSGTSANDGVTKVGTLTVSGTEANATVQYSSNGSTWSTTAPTLSQGSNTIYVRQVDLAGNVSSATPFTFTYDTTAPSAPALALATDSGASGSDRISNAGTVTVSDLETGATWEYTTNGGTNWTAGTGTSFTLAEGGYASGAVKVRQTDSAGNLGAEASLGATVIDATAPVVSSATVSGASLVLGYTEANRLDAVNHAGTSAFTVKVGGSTVTVSSVSVDATNGTVTLTLGSAVVAGQSVTVSYADPTVGDDASATQDEAGNDAGSFTDRAVTNATGATTPTQTVVISKAVDDVAPKVGDLTSGASTNDTAPELRGTISAALGTGEVLAVYRDGVKIGTATVSGTAWTYADTGLSNGSAYSYTARVENLVNPGTASTAFALTIDTTAPSTPAITSATDDAAPVLGTVANGGVTNDTTPALTGTAEANSTVSVYDGTTLLGTTTANGSGVWTYTPTALSQGPHSFTVRATDAAGNVSGASTAYALTIDAAPVGTDTTISTLEDTPRALTTADFGFLDADTGDALVKVKVTQLPTAGTLALNGTVVVLDQEISRADIDAGKLVFTPAANANGAGYASVAFKLSDGTVYADAANVLTIDVTPVNDAPVAAAGSVTMAEDATRAFQASDFGFTDVEGHGLAAVIITSRPLAGTLAYNGTALTAGDVASGFVVGAADLGKLTFTPARDANGTGYASFAFKVRDNGGTANGGQDTSAAAVLTINVTPVNDAPTGADRTVSTAEDTPYTLAAADFGFADVDAGDALAAVTVTRLPSAGTLTLNGTAVTTDQVISRADIDAGKLVFTPASDANGTGYANFAFKVSDGALTSATANTITVDVSAVNDAPLAVAQTVAAVEDVERTITLSGTDVDGDALTYRVNRPAAGSLFQVNADGSRGGAITADGTVVTDGAHRVIYVSAPDGNGAGHGSFTFTVADASVASAPATVTVNVTPVNDAPALTGTKATLAGGTEDTPYTIRKADLLAGFTDVDGDPLSVADLVADHGRLTDNGDGTWTFTPDADYNGPVGLTYAVTDGQGGRTAATQGFALSAVNDAPALTGTKATLAAGTEDTPYVIRKADLLAGFTDADGDGLSVTGLTATNGTLTDNGDGTWTFTPNADYNGPVGLTYGVTDGKGGSVAASTGFALAAANDAAVIGDPTSAAVTEDLNVTNGKLIATGTLSIQDVDAGEGTFRTTVGSDPGNLGGLALQADGTYAYSVDNSAVQFLGAGQTRTDSFTVTSFDGTTKRISFTITGVNDAAVIGGTDAGTVTEDKDVTAGGQLVTGGTLTIADADAGEASVQPQAGTAGRYGTFTLAADGRWTYAADNAQAAIQQLGAGETLTETFTVKAFDNTTHTVTVTIAGANDAAVIGTPTVSSVTEDLNVVNGLLTAAGTIAISDADQGQAAFQTAVASSAGNLGSLTLQADGRYVYTVDNNAVQFLGAGQTKVDTFILTAKDGTTRPVAITINGANDAPTFTSGPASVAYADTSAPDTFQPFTGTLAARDADGDAVAFGIGGGTVQGGLVTKVGTYGTLTVNSAIGAFTFVPDAAAIDALPGGVNPVETFTVTLADGRGGTASQTLTINLTGANETPAVSTTPVATPTETPVAQPAAPTVTAPTPVVLSTVEPTRPTTSTSVSQAVASVLSATASTLPRPSTDLTAQDTSPSVVAQTATARDSGGQPLSPTSLAPSSYRGNSLLPPSVSFIASADTMAGASLITVGSVGDRVVTPGQPNLISVPAGTFQTSDPNAHITLQASLSDGSPLPAWLKFDSANGTFSGNPPPDLKVTMSIKVIARDDQGAQATTEFRLNIGNNASDGAGDAAPKPAPKPAAGRGNADGKIPADGSPVPEEQPSAPAESTPTSPEPGERADADPVKAPVGKLAFSRQVSAQAPSGLLAEGEDLLRSIQMLLAG